jgi:signal peptidase I
MEKDDQEAWGQIFILDKDEQKIGNVKNKDLTPLYIEFWREAKRDICLTIEGTSMEPVLMAGDVVTVRLFQPDRQPCRPPLTIGGNEGGLGVSLKRGDLIAYRNNGHVIVHRFMTKRRAGTSLLFCQKGDNLTGWGWIQEDVIMGKVVSIRRKEAVFSPEEISRNPLNRVVSRWWYLRISVHEWMREKIVSHRLLKHIYEVVR